MKYSKYSVVVVGSGIAGTYAALKIEQQANLPDGIVLITKGKLGESNSRYAQGGMVAVLKENKSDSVSSHVSDTIKAGAGLSDFNAVKFISENSDMVVKDLLKTGVEFDRDEDNKLTFTMEAAHSTRRILHSGGDATGRMMEEALCRKVKENDNIEIYENTMAVELLLSPSRQCRGLVIYNELTDEYETIYSPAVILATGGVGQLYKYTTNPSGATGDGLALAYNAGAVMQDMEFVQFHPTALAFDDDENRFLISEAVRGEGAKLVDADGIEFMSKYDERKELAPRDIVARSIFNEMSENNVDNVYLNATCIDSQKLAKRFPTISKKCLDRGIDIAKDFIPVAPAAHFFMGGIKTDLLSRTSIEGLYAIGEVASNGLHGGNRLASNSLLECVVCAYEVADYIKTLELKTPKQIGEDIKSSIDEYSMSVDSDIIDIVAMKAELQEIMWENVGILRTEKSLMTAVEKLSDLRMNFHRNVKCLNKDEYEFKNMLTVAMLIATSAMKRRESRGAHYRLDYQQTDEVSRHNCFDNNEEGEFSFAK